MRRGRPDGLADLGTAFLIGAGLGVAATMLLRTPHLAPRRRRLLRRLGHRLAKYRDLRAVLASIGER